MGAHKAINLQGFCFFLSLFLSKRKSEYNNFSKSGAFCSYAPNERRSLSPENIKNGMEYRLPPFRFRLIFSL
jgi:hypothetical protein